jgi:hypothetical protein
VASISAVLRAVKADHAMTTGGRLLDTVAPLAGRIPGLAPPTLASLVIVIGGISQRPCVVDGQVVVRDIADLTIAADHTVAPDVLGRARCNAPR